MKAGPPFLAPSPSRGWGHACPAHHGPQTDAAPSPCLGPLSSAAEATSPVPQGPALAQPESPQVGMTSQEVSRAILDRDPPPAVCTDTRGGRGQGGRARSSPGGLGWTAELLWGCPPPAVHGILPRHTGPLPPALRRELEPSCTQRSSYKADVDASLSHQQPHLFVH